MKVDKQKSLATLIKELDTVFSLFIRLRDANGDGIVTCFVTGERVWWKDSDAAHFVPRGQMATRWDEKNVHACTKDSNRYDPQHADKYIDKMLSVYGKETVHQIVSQAVVLAKWTRPEINEMIIKYQNRVNDLKWKKGL